MENNREVKREEEGKEIINEIGKEEQLTEGQTINEGQKSEEEQVNSDVGVQEPEETAANIQEPVNSEIVRQEEQTINRTPNEELVNFERTEELEQTINRTSNEEVVNSDKTEQISPNKDVKNTITLAKIGIFSLAVMTILILIWLIRNWEVDEEEEDL